MNLPIIYSYKLVNAGGGKHVYDVTYWELANHQSVSYSRSTLDAWIFAEYMLGGPSNIRLVLRGHFGDQDLNRLLLHAFDGVCVPGVDVDAPNLHRHLGHRRNHPTRSRLHLLPAVQWQHPGNRTEQRQAQMPTTFQRGRWL